MTEDTKKSLHGVWLVRFNRFCLVRRWIVESREAAGRRTDHQVLSITIDVPSRTYHDENQTLFSIKVEGWLTITDGHATISHEPKEEGAR